MPFKYHKGRVKLTDELIKRMGGEIEKTGVEAIYYIKGYGYVLKKNEAFFHNEGQSKCVYLDELLKLK